MRIKKILRALAQYYSKNISLERTAEIAGVPIWLLIKFMEKYNLPVVCCKEDAERGLKILSKLR